MESAHHTNELLTNRLTNRFLHMTEYVSSSMCHELGWRNSLYPGGGRIAPWWLAPVRTVGLLSPFPRSDERLYQAFGAASGIRTTPAIGLLPFGLPVFFS